VRKSLHITVQRLHLFRTTARQRDLVCDEHQDVALVVREFVRSIEVEGERTCRAVIAAEWERDERAEAELARGHERVRNFPCHVELALTERFVRMVHHSLWSGCVLQRPTFVP
jgi:hypothetical protein